MSTTPNKPTPEQQIRDILERMGVHKAQSYSAGELVELANILAERDYLRLTTREKTHPCPVTTPPTTK